MKLWAGRFSKEVSKTTNDFNSSIRTDSRMYKEDIEGSIAHAAMLGMNGIITPEDADKIINGLKEIEKELTDGSLVIPPDSEDIHTFVEGELT